MGVIASKVSSENNITLHFLHSVNKFQKILYEMIVRMMIFRVCLIMTWKRKINMVEVPLMSLHPLLPFSVKSH